MKIMSKSPSRLLVGIHVKLKLKNKEKSMFSQIFILHFNIPLYSIAGPSGRAV